MSGYRPEFKIRYLYINCPFYILYFNFPVHKNGKPALKTVLDFCHMTFTSVGRSVLCRTFSEGRIVV